MDNRPRNILILTEEFNDKLDATSTSVEMLNGSMLTGSKFLKTSHPGEYYKDLRKYIVERIGGVVEPNTDFHEDFIKEQYDAFELILNDVYSSLSQDKIDKAIEGDVEIEDLINYSDLLTDFISECTAKGLKLYDDEDKL